MQLEGEKKEERKMINYYDYHSPQMQIDLEDHFIKIYLEINH